MANGTVAIAKRTVGILVHQPAFSRAVGVMASPAVQLAALEAQMLRSEVGTFAVMADQTDFRYFIHEQSFVFAVVRRVTAHTFAVGSRGVGVGGFKALTDRFMTRQTQTLGPIKQEGIDATPVRFVAAAALAQLHRFVTRNSHRSFGGKVIVALRANDAQLVVQEPFVFG
jgi:hypothetical protein